MRRRIDRGNRMDFGEEANPMGGVSNLADAMLVLAVGIMLALIMNWHVDIAGGYTKEMDKGSMEEVESTELQDALGGESADSLADLEEEGTVYIDKKTGKMYLVKKDGN